MYVLTRSVYQPRHLLSKLYFTTSYIYYDYYYSYYIIDIVHDCIIVHIIVLKHIVEMVHYATTYTAHKYI